MALLELAVLGSASYVDADGETLPLADVMEENLARVVHQAQALGIETIAAPGP